jgi:hypothetical protein
VITRRSMAVFQTRERFRLGLRLGWDLLDRRACHHADRLETRLRCPGPLIIYRIDGVPTNNVLGSGSLAIVGTSDAKLIEKFTDFGDL